METNISHLTLKLFIRAKTEVHLSILLLNKLKILVENVFLL